MRKHSVIFAAVVLTALSLVLPAAVYAQPSVVVPNRYTHVEGDSNNIFPFACGVFFSSQRYQQVYSGSEIGSGEIDTISFRLKLGGTGFSPQLFPGMQINMSTTQAEPGNLSPAFADNVGPDDTVVVSGIVTLSAPDCITSPCPFTVVIPLDTPFTFDPGLGNLLVDIRIPDCTNIGSVIFDATSGTNPTVVSRVNSDSVDAVTGQADNVGLVTQFSGTGFISGTTQPIPTLSEWGMIAAAAGLMLVGVFFAVRRKRMRDA